MAIVELRNISKTYDKVFKAVDNVNLKIENGEFVVLVGPSGCGKTTLLNMIAGLENITSGELFINEVKCNNIEPKDRNIAMVFQNYALYPHMNVFNNIAFPLKNRKEHLNIINEKVEKIAKMLMIEDILYKKPGQLSGGQKQRVAIGRAIVRNPTLFLMDEPLSNLDAALRNKMRVELKELHRDLRATIIFVTHDQIEALTLATKIVVMNGGKIQQIGLPSEIFNKPTNEFVAKFLGTPQMNFFYNCRIISNLNESYILFFNKKIFINNCEFIDGESIDIGVRPTDFEILSEDDKQGINVHVNFIEFLGSECVFHCEGTWEDNSLKKIVIAIQNCSDIELERKSFHIRPRYEKLHFFNKDTKERLNVIQV